MKNPKIEQNLMQFIKNNNNNSSLYWYPLVNAVNYVSVAYDIVKIYRDNHIFLLEQIANLCNIEKVTMFQMDHGECFENERIAQLLYERDEDGYTFQWYAETFLFDRSKEWLIYLSHENTISFTGEKIVTVAKQIIPSCYFVA